MNLASVRSNLSIYLSNIYLSFYLSIQSTKQPSNQATKQPTGLGVIRLPQVAQHAQLHAPVVLCEDRARWIERLWVGGVAKSHIEPEGGVGRREVGDLGTGGR